MESYLFFSSLRDFMRPRRVGAWLVVSVVMFFIGQQVISLNPHQAAQDHYVTLSAALVFRLLPLAAAIFSMAVVAQEVEQKTIVYMLTRPVARWKLITFRTLAASTVVMLVSAVAAEAICLAAYGRPFTPLLGRDLIAIVIGSITYTALFVVVSLLINKAMIVCLLFAFGWETTIPNLPGDLYLLSISSYVSGVAQRPSTDAPKSILDALGGMFGVNTMTSTTAWIVLIGITAACLGFAAVWFAQNEYVPREDAE